MKNNRLYSISNKKKDETKQILSNKEKDEEIILKK
jgi:hypothetical protein